MNPLRRNLLPILGVVMLVLAVGVGAASLAWELRDRDSQPEVPGYDSVGVPWWDGRALHWHGQSIKERDVASLTASRNAAVFLHDRRAARRDDSGALVPGRGTLTALFNNGSTQELAKNVIGVPLADPNGHTVAWMVQAGDDTVVVTAFDTRERAVLGSQRLDLESGGLTAVVGDTVYLTTGRKALAWQPRDGVAPTAVAGVAPRWFAVVGGARRGLLVVGADFEMGWIGKDGREQRVGSLFGSVSPDGRYVATTDDDDQYRRNVREILTGDVIDLGLPDDQQVYQARWAGDGTLVVAAVARADIEDGWDDAFSVTNYACDVPSGECRALEGGPRVIGLLPLYEDSYLGVFLAGTEGMFN